MTPQALYRQLNALRRKSGATWAQVAADLDVSEDALDAMRRGVVSGRLRGRVEQYLGDTFLPTSSKEMS